MYLGDFVTSASSILEDKIAEDTMKVINRMHPVGRTDRSIDRSGDNFEEYICNKTYLTCTVSQERKSPEAIFEQIINKNILMQTPIKLLVFALGLLDSASADSNQAETPICS